MRIHNITHDDMLNGTGLRVVLWVAGCTHHCKECHNPITWDACGGIPFTEWEEAEVFTWLSKPWTEGITFSGGDPLHPNNRKKIGELADFIKRNYPDKNIWCYTGYTLCEENGQLVFKNADASEVFSLEWLDKIDVLVDGNFDCNQRRKDIENGTVCHWRGSSNQKIINVPLSIESGSICLWEEKT